jgi:hypothetical protein
VFKIMTWNVENLFKPGASSGPPTQAIFDAKIQGLASTINAQSPDALALQEIGDPRGARRSRSTPRRYLAQEGIEPP